MAAAAAADQPQQPRSTAVANFENSAGLRYEAQEVHRCIVEKKPQSGVYKHNDSLMVAAMADEIRRQIGVRYVEDDESKGGA